MLRVVTDGETRPQPRYRSTAEPVDFGEGFYAEERDDVHVFRWMAPTATLRVSPRSVERYLEIWVFSNFRDLSQELVVEGGGRQERRVLVSGWARISVAVAAGVERLDLRVDKPFPRSHYPEDPRTLAIRIRTDGFVHEDAERHRQIAALADNRIANWRELLAGKVRLDSTPPTLGIDMYGICNVKPPCVYCEWDVSKDMEGDNVEAPFTRETLEDWGETFTHASTLVNCSIGEPFMMKNLDELFDIYGDGGKALEMTTNGQILTDRNIDRLLDREIDLYISLDAATPETYAQLRNDTFERILTNLRRLIAAKGGRDGLPRVHLVFMPMKCNLHELEAFVELCAELEVDRLVLRPLNFSESISLKWERAGYVFDYSKELLPFDELIRVSARAAQLCAEHGVPLSDQLDFGGAMDEMFAQDFAAAPSGPGGESAVAEPLEEEATNPQSPPVEASAAAGPVDDPSAAALESLGEEALPACLEPWTSLYILRRGIVPCCYGGHPVAGMDGHQEAWNAPIVQEIRAELAAGRFHSYCLRSPACPIVRKDSHAGTLPPAQAIYLRGRELLQQINRHLGGIPGRVLRPSKWRRRRT